MSEYLNMTDWQVFLEKMVTILEVIMTGHRQVDGPKVGIKSCGGSMKYQTCFIFADPP